MKKYLDLIENIKMNPCSDNAVEEITRCLKDIKEIEAFLFYNIRCVKKEKRDLVLNEAFNKIAEKKVKGGEWVEKEIELFYPMLSNVDNDLIRYGETIFDYTEKADFVEILENGLKLYLERARKGKAYVAIFWVVDGVLYLHREALVRRELIAEGIEVADCSYSHFCKWEFHQILHPVDDFATYPRGRIMYDVRRREHIIYADECVKMEEIKKIVELCYIKKYVIMRDDHYRCDNCMKGEEI